MFIFSEGFKNPDRRYAIFPIIHEAAAAEADPAVTKMPVAAAEADPAVTETSAAAAETAVYAASASAAKGCDNEQPPGPGLDERLNALGLAVSIGGDTERRGVRSRAEYLRDLGFAGVVGNVPYGQNFPDGAEDWSLMEKGFRDIIKHGMSVWIYDEKGYPSGTAGGIVLDDNADFIAEGLYCYEYWRTLTGPISYRADTPGDKLYRALLLPLDGGEAVDVTHFLDEKGVLRMQIPEGDYRLFMMSARRLFDGTHAAESYCEPRNYISLNDRKAVEAFLRVTHEKYARYLSDEFGKGVLAFFTDEPSLISWNIRKGVYPIVPWHRDFPDEFMKTYGYPVELAVTAVVTKRGPEYIKRRCDFWEFVGESTAENFFGAIQDWCRRHKIKSSGHMLWEESLQSHVYCYGSLYKCGKRMDWPGIDQLNSEPQQLMNTNVIPIARLLASFADISGENESFTEFSDHSSRMANRQIGVGWIRASINWHYAMGINNLTSYYKFDNFSDEEIVGLNRYAARLGYLIRQGRRDSRVAVLYPEASIWSVYTPSTEPAAMDGSEDTRLLDHTFIKTSWELLRRQIDFDYVDEKFICDGVIRDGRLSYRHNAYECLILPGAHVLSSETVDKIAAMAEAGIGIVIIGDMPKIDRRTGAPAGFARTFSQYAERENFAVVPVTANWTLPGIKKIPAIPRHVTVTPHKPEFVLTGAEGAGGYADGEIISADILSHARILANGDRIVFLCNMGGKTYEGALRAEGGAAVSVADPFTGEITNVESYADNQAVYANVTLRPYDGFCYIIKS